MKKYEEKFTVIGKFITAITVVLGIVEFLVLKDKVAVQWQGSIVSSIADKKIVLIFPIISILTYFAGQSIIQYIGLKWFGKVNQTIVVYIQLLLLVLLLTCQLYIGLYSIGLRLTISGILVIELIVGIIIGIKINKEQRK
ncbi:MAG: hypothetical protein LKI32_00065 [Lachnospiraceae bacterium]|jgi:hypothetical protein|nr:hypothetical protein [Lachnospiraceae bacterium]MCI1655940.1 hypothetical protein [Lachnospiraceae bacterium]MCI2194422.1 hypothetical protein [Lachnospiraceae bacterium]